ncbi:OmpA family protein [Sediminitomix flava]|uniref:Peptidoglycan-associated lipoprotein n=1 Tax=Sediminitomix flava TaxID=379075 RepID=A0A315ZDW4_SEDFL|nr:OmpA family protein [Sediminitomix flava]PWJ43343.1 peptidoglycan-associated lipoprotein [Sediminitomix flava]
MNTPLFRCCLLLLFLAQACGGSKNIAEKKFQLGEYNSAIPLYEKKLSSAKMGATEQAEINFKIGECYRLSNRVEQAVPYYKKAIQNGFQDEDILFYYAYGLKKIGEYEKAVKYFKAYKKDGEDFKLIYRTKKEIKLLSESIHSIIKEDPFIEITNCSGINTDAAEFSPTLWNDKVVFTASRDNDMIYEGNGAGYTDLFVHDLEEVQKCEGEIQKLSDLINTPGFHEASATFSKDGKTVIFARSNSGKKKDDLKEVNLYESVYDGNDWSEPKLLSINHPKFWNGCPALSANGKTLYFVSNRPGTLGGLDIFKASKSIKGEWTKVTNLGKKINSRGNEMFPYVAKDGKLYFASDGLPGLGGLDLFVAVRKDKKIVVENMGKPFNSPADDFSICFFDKKNGAFSSNRNDGDAKGDDDIYLFTDTTPNYKVLKYYLQGFTFNENADGDTLVVPEVALELVNEKGEAVAFTESDEKGYFKFDKELEMGPEYTIVAIKQRYLADSLLYTTAEKEIEQETVKDRPEKIIDITLDTEVPMIIDIYEELISEGEVTLNNILYDFDDYRIRPDAAKELDKLVSFMNQHTDITIILGSHTDTRGSRRHNQKLAENRAKAAVEYIVSRGVSDKRLKAKGYGEDYPYIYDAQTEEEHQLNRRTTVQLSDEEEFEEF